jgi:hypothetical protein
MGHYSYFTLPTTLHRTYHVVTHVLPPRASVHYVMPSFDPSRPPLLSLNHRLIGGPCLHEHQLPPLGSCAHRPVRNHEMRKFIRELMRAEANCD